MNRPHFRRRPRPTDPEPEYSRLDHLDGLPGRTRYDAQWPDVLAAEAASAEQIARVGAAAGVSADEWSSLPPVFRPHSFVGGDLAAMAATPNLYLGLDWRDVDATPAGWGEGYEIEPETRIGRHAWTPAEMRAMGDAIHDVVQAAHPRVDEADVEALAGLLESAELTNYVECTYRPFARRLLATGRVSVTHE